MAQIGRTAPASATTALASNRPTAGNSNVASVTRAPIEAMNAKLGTSLADAFLFHAYQNDNQPTPERHASQTGRGLVRATSQAFAAFLEFDTGYDVGSDTGSRGGVVSFAGVLARAIETYETNARVISGADVPRGKILSINL